jgi:hypothetical protein
MALIVIVAMVGKGHVEEEKSLSDDLSDDLKASLLSQLIDA